MSDRILALDVGTSRVKAIVTDLDGLVVASSSRSYGLQAAEGGWVDQDFDEILGASLQAMRALVDGLLGRGREIVVVSVTAQMFNLVAVDATGRPVLPMLSWLDQRSQPQARDLAVRMPPEEQYRKLGAVVSAKDILPKILWLRDRRPDAYAATAWLLDCKEAVVMGLTGRADTDFAGASAFRLCDKRTRTWDREVCRELGIAPELLPDVVPATAIAGGISTAVARQTGLLAGTPVAVGSGDVAASQVGSGAVRVGDAHVSLGTAVYFGVTLAEPADDPGRWLGVLGHMDPGAWILWLEIATGGGALGWLASSIGTMVAGRPVDYGDVDRMVAGCAGEMDDLLFAPWLSGERVPVFDDRVRAAFVGIGLNHGPAHLFRAVMEGVAYQMRWALEYGEAFGQPLEEIRAVGGGGIGEVWTQIIADTLDRPIKVIRQPQDAAAVGAAACGMVALGVRPDFLFARDLAIVDREYLPDPRRRSMVADGYGRFRQLYDALAPLPRRSS
ncbi:MAG: xylulokinase [Candidatus Limnocylindrales bacterium]